METIADSSAQSAPDRVLKQHYGALSYLKENILAATDDPVHWLDLACGEGQILRHLSDSLSEPERRRLHYYGLDGNSDYCRATEALAAKVGLGSCHVEAGDIMKFPALYDGQSFRYLTLTNTLHEIAPRKTATLLADCILRLEASGSVFVFDMESVHPLELGAVLWRKDEIQVILDVLVEALGGVDRPISVSAWPFSTTTGWQFIVKRKVLRATQGDLEARRESAVAATWVEIERLLKRKLEACKALLHQHTMDGTETMEEDRGKIATLYDLWALLRALEVRQ